MTDELLAADFKNNDPVQPQVTEREGMKAWVLENRQVFPDFHWILDDMIAEG